MKSLDEHVEEFRMPFGKWKDCLLEDVDNSYLEWYLEQPNISRWHRKLIERHMEQFLDGIDRDDYQDFDDLDEEIPF